MIQKKNLIILRVDFYTLTQVMVEKILQHLHFVGLEMENFMFTVS